MLEVVGVSFAVSSISEKPYVESDYVNGKRESARTTITPFSDVLKKETKHIAEQSASSAGEAVSGQSAMVGGQSAAVGGQSAIVGGQNATVAAQKTEGTGSVAVTNGTSGKMSADGTLTTTLDDIFRRASEKYGVSYEYLVAVAKAESDFNPNCVSSAGAKGIMQIMPYEAKELGITDVFDPEQNIMGAAKLLKAHLEKFDGDTTLAAAAYNAGSGRVKQYGGVPPFKETRNYVKKIAAYMKEGVKVPDKTVTVTPNKLSGDVTKSQSRKTGQTAAGNAQSGASAGQIPGAVPATEEELNRSMVVVGSGDQAVRMTYGAYLRYLELGDLGVG